MKPLAGPPVRPTAKPSAGIPSPPVKPAKVSAAAGLFQNIDQAITEAMADDSEMEGVSIPAEPVIPSPPKAPAAKTAGKKAKAAPAPPAGIAAEPGLEFAPLAGEEGETGKLAGWDLGAETTLAEEVVAPPKRVPSAKKAGKKAKPVAAPVAVEAEAEAEEEAAAGKTKAQFAQPLTKLIPTRVQKKSAADLKREADRLKEETSGNSGLVYLRLLAFEKALGGSNKYKLGEFCKMLKDIEPQTVIDFIKAFDNDMLIDYDEGKGQVFIGEPSEPEIAIMSRKFESWLRFGKV
jgi:hypothetical protein